MRRAIATSPVFLTATALLLLNDHWFKGVGPGALTGKLSDVVGLIVAPALVAGLVPASRRGLRALAFLLPVAVFVGINVSPAIARSTEWFMAGVGVPWQIWCDPSDLWALFVLPLPAWWIAEGRTLLPSSVSTASFSVIHRWLGRVSIALAALACVATAPPNDPPEGTHLLINDTDEAISVRVRAWEGLLDCDRLPADLDAEGSTMLALDGFGDGVTYDVQPGEELPINHPGESLRCMALLVSGDGIPPTLVFGEESFYVGLEGLHELGRALTIRTEGARRIIDTPLWSGPLDERRRAPSEPGAWWSPMFVSGELDQVETTIDDCARLVLVSGDEARAVLGDPVVCAPNWALDTFEIGQPLVYQGNSGGLHIESQSHTLDIERQGSSLGEISDALGRRDSCGTYLKPLRVILEGVELSEEPMLVGDGEWVALDRAEQAIAAPLACGETLERHLWTITTSER